MLAIWVSGNARGKRGAEGEGPARILSDRQACWAGWRGTRRGLQPPLSRARAAQILIVGTAIGTSVDLFIPGYGITGGCFTQLSSRVRRRVLFL